MGSTCRIRVCGLETRAVRLVPSLPHRPLGMLRWCCGADRSSSDVRVATVLSSGALRGPWLGVQQPKRGGGDPGCRHCLPSTRYCLAYSAGPRGPLKPALLSMQPPPASVTRSSSGTSTYSLSSSFSRHRASGRASSSRSFCCERAVSCHTAPAAWRQTLPLARQFAPFGPVVRGSSRAGAAPGWHPAPAGSHA